MAYLQPAAARLHPGAPGLGGGDPHGIPPGGPGDRGPTPQRPRRRPRFYEALLPRTFAAVNAGGPPFADLEGALLAAGLAPSYAVAADDAAWDEPIRQSMAEAFAAAGGVVRTPAIVLDQDPPVGFLGPVLAAPRPGPRRCGCGMRWRPWPPCPASWSSRVLACHTQSSRVAPAPSCNRVGRTRLRFGPERRARTACSASREHNWLTSKVLLTALRVHAVGSVTQRTGQPAPGGTFVLVTVGVVGAGELNLRPLPCQQTTGEPLCSEPFSQVTSDRRPGRETLSFVQLNALFACLNWLAETRASPSTC
jgi:hypothetical protein